MLKFTVAFVAILCALGSLRQAIEVGNVAAGLLLAVAACGFSLVARALPS
jgi:uncharacterized membrane protein YjfL (UPF0719 family)